MIRNLLWAAPFALAVLALAAALLIEAAPATVGYAGLGVVASLGALGFLAIRTGQRRARQGEGAAELFRGALSGSREAWLITSLDGRTLYANRALRALAGGGSEAPSLNLLWPMGSSEAAQLETLRTEAASGRSASVELPLERGELRVFDVAVEPGAEGSLVWRLSELTEGRNRAAEMAAERDWFAGLIEHAPLGLFAADATGRFLYVNKTLARALGREAEELIGSGSTLGRFVLPSRGAEAEAVVWSEPGRGIGKAEVRLSGPGGEPWRALIAHHTVRLGADGSQPVTVGAVRNLDGEADWQEALKHSERRFRGLFDHAPIGIALLDLEGRVVESNSAFRALVGVGTEGGAARLLTDLLKGVDAGDVRAAVRSIVRGEKIQLPLEITLALPEDRVLLLYLSRLEEAGGALSGLIVHLIDNSEQRRLELQFAQAQKMQAVGQLAGGIAHDFNNVLTAVLGFCDLLLMRHQAGDHSFSDIMQIKQNATRATNLVRQLLAFSRQQTLKPKVTDLTDLLSELSHLLHRLIGENIEFKLVHERDLWLVKVDQGPFEQVIINLAVNARDSMSEGGTLTIRTQNAPAGTWTGPGRALLGGGDYVVIEVADTGVGIPRELHDKIFEPFFTTKEVGAGTGLGLSTVYGIVKQFHGFIFVDSAPLLYLPAAAFAQGAGAAEGGGERGAGAAPARSHGHGHDPARRGRGGGASVLGARAPEQGLYGARGRFGRFGARAHQVLRQADRSLGHRHRHAAHGRAHPRRARAAQPGRDQGDFHLGLRRGRLPQPGRGRGRHELPAQAVLDPPARHQGQRGDIERQPAGRVNS